MILFKTANELSEHLSRLSAKGHLIGFVPTMGALHQGHLSLIAESRKKTNITVCSIFVNPTQFNDPADFEKYPVTIERDILLLEQSGCDLLFLPPVNEIYPHGTRLQQKFDLGALESILEGSYRPGHFQGVCQVVHRLLEIVQPGCLFLGQKDFQQCMVIQSLIRSTGWHIETVIVPTLREPTGLAMSSRNMRLSEAGMQKATAIYRCLSYLRESIHAGHLEEMIKAAEAMLLQEGFDKIDYIAIANAETLLPLHTWDGKAPVIGLVAAFLEGVRLIDNMIFASPPSRMNY